MPRKKAEAPATKAPKKASTSRTSDNLCSTSHTSKGTKPKKTSTCTGGVESKKAKAERVKPYQFKPGDPRTIECAKKGAAASAEAQRRRKAMREDLDYLLSLPETDKRRLKKLSSAGIKSEDAGLQMSMLYGLLMSAVRGDSKAAKVLIDILGEDSKPADEGVQIVDDL